ncbi:MAG: acyl-CoA dehydrogenase family protein [Mycobacteriaceae bacterium]
MDFTLDETQQAVAEAAIGVLRRDVDGTGGDVFRAEPGYDQSLWKEMAKAGLLSLVLPEDLGGEGLGPVETAVVLTEVGRNAAAVPALATLALGVLPLVRLGSTAQQQAVLAEVEQGRVLTAALNEVSAPMPESPATTARVDGDVLIVNGTKVAVPYAAAAYRMLVPTSTGVLLIDPQAVGVTLVRTPSSAGSPEYTVRFTDVRVASSELLEGGDAAELYRCALAGAGAVADGLLSGAMELTAKHLATRHQFGKPLATFQAVAQQIADIYVTSRTLHVAALSGSWRLGAGLDAADDLDVLAYWLATEVPAALQVCHHLHGGLGVDITYPLHRYSSLAKDLARFVGGASYRLDLLGAQCSSI